MLPVVIVAAFGGRRAQMNPQAPPNRTRQRVLEILQRRAACGDVVADDGKERHSPMLHLAHELEQGEDMLQASLHRGQVATSPSRGHRARLLDAFGLGLPDAGLDTELSQDNLQDPVSVHRQ